MKLKQLISAAVVPAVVASVLLAGADVQAAPPQAARYLIEYPHGNAQALKAFIERSGGTVVFDYAAIDGLAADLSPAALRAVRRSGLATTVQEDGVRSLHSHLPDFTSEFVGWGVNRIGADAVWSSDPNGGDPNVRPDPAATGAGVVVGVLDSGIDYGHPDLAANILDLRGDGAIRDFLDGDEDPTDSAGNGHGSNVASTIASVDNDVGVIGVAPAAMISPYRVCNVNCPLSAIIGGLLQAIADGVDVINMSFGGAPGFNLEAKAIQAANRAGIVLVASAGNDASQHVQMPAGYDTVIAVGATQEEGDLPASFTNYGGWVDVTGPGVEVPVASCRGCGRDAFLSETSPTAQAFSPLPMTGSAVAAVAGTEIVHVGRGCNADSYLADPAGKVALIRRGACSFAEKVARAEAAGAVGTVVANNIPGNFNGTLGSFVAAGPSASVSQADGDVLVAETDAGTTTVDYSVIATDYELVDGTSFSAPHVAGVAALVKSVNPALSAIEVRKIIESTAEPIGPQVIFGAGMVRADLAVQAAQASQ